MPSWKSLLDAWLNLHGPLDAAIPQTQLFFVQEAYYLIITLTRPGQR